MTAVGNRYSVDFGAMARTMTDLMDSNIVDPTLREWILPNFSTTPVTDLPQLAGNKEGKNHSTMEMPDSVLVGRQFRSSCRSS